MELRKLLFCMLIFLMSAGILTAGQGNVFIHFSAPVEKNLDSLKNCFASDSSVTHYGICIDSNVLLLQVAWKNQEQVDKILSVLKKNGFNDLELKEDVSPDRFHQSCSTFILFR